MNSSIKTERLSLDLLSANDWKFILELVNTDGWIEFIGNRKIYSEEDAKAYIQRIIDNPDFTYWTVKLKDKEIPVGVITWIRRSYLPHHDIGFAFLPAFFNNGYAYEATRAVFGFVTRQNMLTAVNAVTLKENYSSIRLLNKLGLRFKEEINIEKERLHVYEASVDQWYISQTVQTFFSAFTSKGNRRPNLDLLDTICLPQALFINRKNTGAEILDFPSFIEPRKKLLTNGTVIEFEEKETVEETVIVGDIASRNSEYEKNGILSGRRFKTKGYNMFHLVRIEQSWKISSVVWQDYEN